MGDTISSDDILAAVRAVLPGHLDMLAREVAGRLASPVAVVDAPGPGPTTDGGAETSRMAKEVAALREQLAQKEREAAEAAAAWGRQRAESEERERNTQASAADAEQARRDQETAAHGLAELAARREEYEGYRRTGEQAHRLLERLLPEWLRDDALASWKERIGKEVYNPTATPVFGLLFAALHGYTAALPDADPKTLHDALRDVGRRLYAFLREDGDTSESGSAHAAEQWARAINRECAGRCEVEVPMPGSAANNQWMFFQPRGGSSPDVVSVRSWCVRDAQRRPVHRAEVMV